MSSFAARLVIVSALSAVAVPLTDTSKLTFEQYVEEFGKVYDTEEYARHEALFTTNLAEVNAHNDEYRGGKHTWYAGVNMYSDWSEEEFAQIKKGKAVHDVHAHPLMVVGEATSNPSRVDWREKNVVTPVTNQGSCGSCWAFSATEVMESHLAIATGNLVHLSPQAFVNCVKNPHDCGGTGGCEGATMELAFNLTAQMGIPLDSTLPYQGHDGDCTPYKAAAKSTGYVKLPVNDASALETAIATKGPISVTVAANWRMYRGGVFKGGCEDGASCDLDHGVVAVGYDKDYWLVRNSWGEGWGEKGYIRLSREYDGHTFTDEKPSDGVACKPYPANQTVGGESGILFDTSYPTGVTSGEDEVFV